ncbi:MAG: HAMP domain-containing histidine kinase [Chitinophagaceae bacterium]|nr:HAMP domain-containing histidine kinase [Chitinophagaceae bacterium]MBK8786881.1 HAMP domain-containing histidine kinase [Chitinophagaceae bacterium]MBK9486645.1 HAMP domain-containing histidine kinase [Chitinophagaceae bacterium]MBL0202501.1 HAMP domain-containing histidine kinase [Chitinophagaceae bacterium]
MFNSLLNWRTVLAVIAIAIVTGTVFYSNHLAKKIAAEEKIKIELWVEATKDIANPYITEINLASSVSTENSKDIPMILTNEKDSIMDHRNLDSAEIKRNRSYLADKLTEFKKLNNPIIWQNPLDSLQTNKVFYGESVLLKQVRYYPLVQLFIVALFIIITLIAISTRNKSTQNQVWAGMAKETAHQMGTPLTSLQGWVELLKETPGMEKIVPEMSKDVDRLKLVSDRFGKIGSTPQLELNDIIVQVENMVSYIKRRSPDSVAFSINSYGETEVKAMVNGPLFDWVIENLLKNGLDAMEGKGAIQVNIKNETAQVTVDVIDSGKGISKQNISKVFKPGFTTKKRGWGLGLTLCKRIIEQYHNGELFVKQSEPGKGTTFRIVLRK